MKKYIIAFLFLLLLSSPVFSATLFENTWNVGTGTGAAAIRGAFSSGSEDADEYEVFSGGYSGANYLQIKMPATGSGWLYGHTSLANPAVVYVRYWARYYSELAGAVFHPIVIGSEQQSETGEGIYIARILDTPSAYSMADLSKAWYSDITITLNVWHCIEFKLSGGGSSTGSIEIHIDGVDETEHFYKYDPGVVYLDDANGGLTLPSFNYIAIETYDDGSHVGAVMDICNLKITDDPTWIGGEDVTAPTCSGNITTSGQTLELSCSETVTFGAGGNGGIAITSSTQGENTATYVSGSGTSTLTYSLSKIIYSGETFSVETYTQPTDGIEDASGNDMLTDSDLEIVNNSTATAVGVTNKATGGTGGSALGGSGGSITGS